MRPQAKVQASNLNMSDPGDRSSLAAVTCCIQLGDIGEPVNQGILGPSIYLNDDAGIATTNSRLFPT